MLAYAGRRDPGQCEPVEVAELAGELRMLLASTLSKKARADVAVEPGSVALGNRATLSQVIMNLFSNASNALGEAAGMIEVDMTTPDMDGAEVLQRLRAAGSRVPVVVSSGYLDASIARRLPSGAFQGFLPNPSGARDLLGALACARGADTGAVVRATTGEQRRATESFAGGLC